MKYLLNRKVLENVKKAYKNGYRQSRLFPGDNGDGDDL